MVLLGRSFLWKVLNFSQQWMFSGDNKDNENNDDDIHTRIQTCSLRKTFINSKSFECQNNNFWSYVYLFSISLTSYTSIAVWITELYYVHVLRTSSSVVNQLDFSAFVIWLYLRSLEKILQLTSQFIFRL